MILAQLIDQIKETNRKLEDVQVEIDVDKIYESLRTAAFVSFALLAIVALYGFVGERDLQDKEIVRVVR